VLPIIDLLILVAWTSLAWSVFHKLLHLALASRFSVLGLGPLDFAIAGGLCLLFAITLAARVWVKANEPRLLRESALRKEDAVSEFDPVEGHGASGRAI
jgi:hypothetical protein